ncbi:beta-N-acetylglucosaminidase domain-containing protein [Streptomyces oryzae]|uniref:Beta-N-acetylglucosaminidase domain-containing protein n=1 Tax=Streptomyces oryzae TaxID=1434886 RepID=A0ABS3XL19_9ACTN|nr:beta-N-acetylglucosaminidase domain-containing protein [Streptomyces oryzae]MBO8195697.1 beta-N-acetylglucosaminidase domain-containing protein [Streptomyces oryzae]
MSAAALTAAVVSGLLGGAPAAQAAPPATPDGPAAGSQDDDSSRDGLPPVWPRPQTMRTQGEFVPAGTAATLIADDDADTYALQLIRSTLREAGVRTVHEMRPGGNGRSPGTSARSGELIVRVGSESARPALRGLRAPARSDLPAGGYRLAAGLFEGHHTVALEGADGDGLFYAAQTLRQLATERDGRHGFPGVLVRDWPTASVRGTTEGFYGQPWTQQERLSQLDFLGRTKQNRYLYAPGDDPYRQASRWRDPYPAAQRADFRELAERAKRNHVTLGWAVSPGQGLCFSSADDRKALLRKLDSMRALGIRAFQLRFEDVSYSEWHCDKDARTYGTGPRAAARAQAELANAVADHLAERHPDAAPLSVVPTEFYQKGRTDYRAALAGKLDDRIEIAWSGVGVVPRTITGAELARARSAFPRHRLVTMDNYPVNDFATDRIFLGPYQGREPAVASGSAALLTNAMKQPTASRIPLFTAADYAWNPRGYRPKESWRAAVDELAGGRGSANATRAAVHALAGNDASSMLGSDESAYLRPLLNAFWSAYERGRGPELDRAAEKLRSAFSTMRTAPSRVPDGLRKEVEPWLTQLSRLGAAGERSVDMLLAQQRGDGAAAWKAQLDVRRLRTESAKSKATVGKGVLADFTDKALKLSDGWTGGQRQQPPPTSKPHTKPKPHGDSGSDAKSPEQGSGKGGEGSRPTVSGSPSGAPHHPLSAAVDSDPKTSYRAAAAPATGTFAPEHPPMLVPPSTAADAGRERGEGHHKRSAEALTVRLPEPRPLRAVTVLTGPHSGTRGTVEAHVPGKGWERLGSLSQTGWTQLTAGRHGAGKADALRLVWSQETNPPVVHEITPWYADTPAASLSLPRTTVDAAIGGGATRVTARLTGNRPTDVRGKVTAKTPKGFTVRTPARTTVRRGSTVDVPLRITADSSVRTGSYRIPVSFGGEHHTLTVRAYPRTSGPDLARHAQVTSSGDETKDFPAAAAADGKRGTRWSSPAKDGEWVQLKLAERARVGQVVLRWQDAYASHYRIQVSPDGKRWRTAATVRDGKGGKEAVRMDAPGDTRYVRVVGDKRATRFGISLWSVEIYGVDSTGRAKHARRDDDRQHGDRHTGSRARQPHGAGGAAKRHPH